MKESKVVIPQAEMSAAEVQVSIHTRHSISRGTIGAVLLKTDNPSHEDQVYRRYFKRNARQLFYLRIRIAYIHSYGVSRTRHDPIK